MAAATGEEVKEKEIYTYEAPFTLYALGWSHLEAHPFRLAVGSFIEEYCNKVKIVQRDVTAGCVVERAEFSHPYPVTKLQWLPEATSAKDILATTGDYLRIWSMNVEENGSKYNVRQEALLNNNKHSEYCAPLTSLDWNPVDTNVVATSSIDTTVTIWDLAREATRTQLIAHDREVFDVSWSNTKDQFATVGADGSIRMFDLRHLDHSTILYESSDMTPLLRVQWNRLDQNFLACLTQDSSRTVIIDVRMPSTPACELKGHTSCVNAVAWAPHSVCHLCTAGDDTQTFIWDIEALKKAVEDPILAYTAEAEVNSVQWSVAHPDWVSIVFNDRLQLLRV